MSAQKRLAAAQKLATAMGRVAGVLEAMPSGDADEVTTFLRDLTALYAEDRAQRFAEFVGDEEREMFAMQVEHAHTQGWVAGVRQQVRHQLLGNPELAELLGDPSTRELTEAYVERSLEQAFNGAPDEEPEPEEEPVSDFIKSFRSKFGS